MKAGGGKVRNRYKMLAPDIGSEREDDGETHIKMKREEGIKG